MVKLVVQGCREDKSFIKTDAPTGSNDAFLRTFTAVAHNGWDQNFFDAQSASLQPRSMVTLLLRRMPHKNPPPGSRPGQLRVAIDTIRGTRDTGAWFEYSKKIFERAEAVEVEQRGFNFWLV